MKLIDFDTDHEPFAVVSISAIRHNISIVRNILNGEKLFFVVKSDAYGHGIELVRYIESLVDGFCVSRVQEAVTLRFLGVKIPIMLLMPVEAKDLEICSRHSLIIPVADIETAKRVRYLKHRILVNIAVDTGMNRIGFNSIGEFCYALELLDKNKKVGLYGVYSHFYNTESRLCCDKQYKEFLVYADYFKQRFGGVAHISASGGVVNGGYSLDAVRVGLLIYGYSPIATKLELIRAMKIVAKPIKNKRFGSDNCLYNSKADGCMSLVKYGYADGLPRAYAPNRCMDISYVEYFGGELANIMTNADDLAKTYGTIAYEILVNCAHRLKKIYIED